ncbi:MAG TPA: pentapeptide repeat-containing protein [Candidatus Eisenbacteria bacterium]|nr:pentapeptide repeat-containing protein [Candidatus Eisenbacteria bacterium]
MAQRDFQKCRSESCPERALSFADSCWEHVDREAFLQALPARVRTAASSGPIALNLKKVTCGNLDFSGLDLRGSSFSQSHLTYCLFIGANLSEVDLIGSRLHGCDFVGAELSDVNLTRSTLDHCSFAYADLRRAYLVEARFKEVDFMGAQLFRAILWNADLTGAKHLKKKNFHDPFSKGDGLNEDNAIVAFESYRTLKHHLHDKGLFEDGSWASYRELTMERKHLFNTRDPRFIPSFLMNLFSGYTEKPNRVILSSLAVVFFFGFVYYLFDVPRSQSLPMARASLSDCVYFSFITFTTVGYGDFAPKAVCWFRLLACTEAFSGPFMAGLYIFTLTRRYAAG